MSDEFTKPERDIREALFAVFYEEEWTLTYRKPARNKRLEQQDVRWKFVDEVIDKLRSQARTKTDTLDLSEWRKSQSLTKSKKKARK